MATTKRLLVIETTGGHPGGHGGKRGRFGLRVSAVTALVALGCVAALTFGGVLPQHAAPVPQAAVDLVVLSTDHGGDSDNLRWCSQTAGPFACAAASTAPAFSCWVEEFDTQGNRYRVILVNPSPC